MEKKEETKQPSGSFSEVWDKRGQETDAANDFRKKIEMEITEARPGYAVGEIVLKPWHMNILGIVHGGVLYSLADTVGGTAAMTGRDYAVPTVDGTIHYLKAGKNTSKIIARAQEIQNGYAFSVCECKIYDDKETLLASATMTVLSFEEEVELQDTITALSHSHPPVPANPHDNRLPLQRGTKQRVPDKSYLQCATESNAAHRGVRRVRRHL